MTTTTNETSNFREHVERLLAQWFPGESFQVKEPGGGGNCALLWRTGYPGEFEIWAANERLTLAMKAASLLGAATPYVERPREEIADVADCARFAKSAGLLLDVGDAPTMPGFMKYLHTPHGMFGKHISPSFEPQVADPMLPLRNLADAVALPAALLWLRGEWTARTGGAGTMNWDRVWPTSEGFWLRLRFVVGDFEAEEDITKDEARRDRAEDLVEAVWHRYGEHLAAQYRRGAR